MLQLKRVQSLLSAQQGALAPGVLDPFSAHQHPRHHISILVIRSASASAIIPTELCLTYCCLIIVVKVMKSINWLRGRPESWSGTVSNTDSVLLEDYTSTLLIGCWDCQYSCRIILVLCWYTSTSTSTLLRCWDCQYSWRIIRTTTFLLRIIRATIYHLSAHVSFSNIVTDGAASSGLYTTFNVQYYHPLFWRLWYY